MVYRSFVPNKTTFTKYVVLLIGFQSSPELQNPQSKAMPGKFHVSGGHSKHNCFQYRANFHSFRTKQIVLILTLVLISISTWYTDRLDSKLFLHAMICTHHTLTFEVDYSVFIVVNFSKSFPGDLKIKRKFVGKIFIFPITVAWWWARWRQESPASRLFTQPVIQGQIQENIKAPRHWHFWGEFTGDRRIPCTKGRWRGKYFHLMTSLCSGFSRKFRATWQVCFLISWRAYSPQWNNAELAYLYFHFRIMQKLDFHYEYIIS